MAKAKDSDYTAVEFDWVMVAPDPVQYKPYNPTFAPRNVAVIVDVPTKYVISADSGKVQLTPKGMAYAIKQLAIAVNAAHHDQV